MKKAILISIVTALAGVAVASAQPPHGECKGGGCGMAKLDSNGDGVVTKDEMLAHMTALFDKADANKDGQVTPEERKAAFDRFADARFTEADKNHDGALSGDELPPWLAQKLNALDTNGDGKLTQQELAAMRAKHEKHFEEREGGGTHTRDEMKAHVEQRFNELDTNHDGKLTQQELAAGHHGRHHGHDEED
jgi:Ca2+-binding EF-hand superfamily protein